MSVTKLNDQGKIVESLQRFFKIEVTGIFDTKLEDLVKQYQSENNLLVDGIVGNNTLNSIFSKFLDIQEHHIYTNKCIPFNSTFKSIFLHHTAGWDDPINEVDIWNKDNVSKVGAHYVIGGHKINKDDHHNDGKIVEAIPEGYSIYHLGKVGNNAMRLNSIGIELCNFGWIKDGKTYVNTEANDSEVIKLDKPFRGFDCWHKYSEQQLKSLRSLLILLASVHNIDLHEGLYKWILEKGADAFEFNSDAYYGKVNGLLTHTNVRKDKFDCSPQPELIDMILSL